MFRSALIKLTAIYLVVLIFISIFFSALVFGIASREMARSLNRPGMLRELKILEQDRPRFNALIKDELVTGRRHLALNLLYVNIALLVAGGGVSYLLARATLRPIERALAAQSRFAADASHELRTPLTALRTEIEVALRNPNLQLPDAKQLLQSNLEELNKLDLLTDGLLRLARLGSDNKDLRETPLADVVSQALARVKPMAEHKQIVLTYADSKSLAKIKGDQTSLVELIVILLDNAIKFSPSDSAVRLTLAEHGRHAIVSVSDQGPGIAAQDLPHIFDRFYRADKSRSQKTPGYGIGLSIAKSIADLHAAELKATSTLGQGSRFSILFRLS
ncbi:MAG: ATP-binding protein [Parcubacteria group bacterium]